MRIALIAPSAMPSRRANTIQTAKMAQAFTRLSHQVLLIAPPNPLSDREITGEGIPPSPYGRGIEGEGIPWQSFAHHYGLTTPFQVTYLPSLPAFKRYDFTLRAIFIAHHWRADLIYTRLPQAAALASLLGIATIFEIHDFPQGNAATWLKIFLHGKGASHLVTITHTLAQALQTAFPSITTTAQPNKINPFLIIAPDGVDLDRYTPWLTPAQARNHLLARGFTLPNQFIAGYTGHLYAGRGIDLIFQLAQQLPDFFFLIVGGEEKDYQHWLETRNQRHLSNIFLRGFVPNAELPLYQMACDVLLMPYQEHVAASSGGDIAAYLSPMKVFEYLASGRPILASNLTVFREILNDTNAILLPPNNSNAWVNALSDLLKTPLKQELLSKGARDNAQKYTWEERVKLILNDFH